MTLIRNRLTKPVSIFISGFFIFSTVFSSPAAAQVVMPTVPVVSTPLPIHFSSPAFPLMPEPSFAYTYDAADQLTILLNQTTPATVISKNTYAYDKIGNRLTGEVIPYIFNNFRQII